MDARGYRPPFRFSLRVLMGAVAIACAYLGWQWRLADERRAMRQLVVESGGEVSTDLNPFAVPGAAGVNWARQLMGDFEVSYFFKLERMTDQDLSRLKQAFPETEIGMQSPWKIGAITTPRPGSGAK
jgi:hypothetical protein